MLFNLFLLSPYFKFFSLHWHYVQKKTIIRMVNLTFFYWIYLSFQLTPLISLPARCHFRVPLWHNLPFVWPTHARRGTREGGWQGRFGNEEDVFVVGVADVTGSRVKHVALVRTSAAVDQATGTLLHRSLHVYPLLSRQYCAKMCHLLKLVEN